MADTNLDWRRFPHRSLKNPGMTVQQDSIRHHCGLFGVYGHEDAVFLTSDGLYALQHRGQESAGIVSTNGEELLRRAGLGLVNEVFDRRTLLEAG